MTETSFPSIDEVYNILYQFSTPNTEKVNYATNWLKKYLNDPRSIPIMFQILIEGSDMKVCQNFLIQLFL